MPNPQKLHIPADQLDGWNVASTAPPPKALAAGAPGAGVTGLLDTLGDVSTGVAKGVGQSAYDLGSIAHRMPYLGNITDAYATILGPDDTNPDAAFGRQPDVLNTTNAAQKVGKVGEQVGEFFIPAGLAKEAAIKGLVTLIPDAASPGMMKVLNKAGAIIGRAAGEAGSAAAISDLHGDSHAGESAGLAGGSSVLGSGLSELAPLIKSPAAQHILPALMAILGMKAVGGVTQGSVGAGFGAYGAGRALAHQVLQNPTTVPAVAKGLRLGVPGVGRTIAGLRSTSETEQGR